MIDGLSNWLLASYVVVVFAQLYFFLMQRSALEVCRDNQLPPEVRFLMLPPSYRAAQVVTVLKWIAVALVFWETGLTWGIAAILLPFMLSAWFPVPHRHFFYLFFRTLRKREDGPLQEQSRLLMNALRATDFRHGVTKT